MSSKTKSMTKNNTKKMLTRIHINLQIQVAIIAILYKKKHFSKRLKIVDTARKYWIDKFLQLQFVHFIML